VIAFNGSFQPIGHISIERAICLIYSKKAYSIKDTEKAIRSASMSIPVPEIIVVPNVRYIKPQRTPFTKRAMLDRDGYKCVYCGCTNRFNLTLDHIIPRNRWKEISQKRGVSYELNSFENCVTACKTCNQRKSSHLLEELGWKPVVGKKPLEKIELDWSSLLEK
jgi:5-methylcytosine-specific restriction endonuclease McrA